MVTIAAHLWYEIYISCQTRIGSVIGTGLFCHRRWMLVDSFWKVISMVAVRLSRPVKCTRDYWSDSVWCLFLSMGGCSAKPSGENIGTKFPPIRSLSLRSSSVPIRYTVRNNQTNKDPEKQIRSDKIRLPNTSVRSLLWLDPQYVW